MIYAVHLFCGSCIFIFQTTLLAHLLPEGSLYDMLIPFVVYLGLFRGKTEGTILTTVHGFMMDVFSAGPFGIFLTAYVWLFALSRCIPVYLERKNPVVLSLTCAGGIVLEGFLFFMAVLPVGGKGPHWSEVLHFSGRQLIWAVVTGPMIICCIRGFTAWWERWYGGYVGARRAA